MQRLEPILPAHLSDEQQSLYREITQGPRAQGPQHFRLTREDGALLGPFNAFLLAPDLGRSLQDLGATVRYRTKLSGRVREMAILIVAAHWDSAFEWSAHESVGRSVGVTQDEMAAIRSKIVPNLADETERGCISLAMALVRGDIDDDTWATWAGVISHEAIFELATLVGYYSTLALQLRVFRVDDSPSD